MATANHQKLTKTLLAGLVAPAVGKRHVIYDTETPKLAMRMTHTGVRAFYVVKRLGGAMVWIKLGTFPDMTCEQARNEAGKVLGEFAKGENPAAVKRAVKAELTFGEAFDEFLERKRKGLVLFGRVALTVVLLQAGLVLYRSVDRYVRNSPEFVIASLTIQGNERVQRADLEQAMGVTIGDNVFARAPEEIEASLEAHPWIAEAHVRRRLPSTFEVQVRERSAVLLLALGASYLVDEDGTVFKALDAADPVDLPVITGVEESRFRSDRSYRTELLTSAIALTTEWSLAGLMRREGIAEIHIEPNEEITLFVGDDGTEVRLGRGPYRAKLLRFRRVMDELQRRQSRPLYVYLDNVRRPDRVTVRVR